MKEETVERKYEKAFIQAASVQPIFPNAAREQMAKMVEAKIIGSKNISEILSTNQSAPIKGGFIAEEFHAETFNLDAILGDNDAKAMTDGYDGWSNHEWNGKLLKTNDNTDIVISKDGQVIQSSQVKYYKNAHDSAGAMSEVVDGKIKYEKNDNYIAPSDQIDGIKAQSLENIQKNIDRNGDPVKRESYKQTHDKVTDKITDGKSSSSKLSKAEANKMGGGDLDKLKKIENDYQTRSTFKQMGNAAVGAAAMSAVVSGSINTIRYIQLAREGKISADEATVKIIGETVAAAADSAVKASANVGVQSLMVRYGSEKAAVQILAKQGLQSMLKTNAVTVGVVCAVEAVKDIVQLGMGNISKDEFFERQGKGIMMTSAGVVGGSLGTAGATAVAATLGVSAGTTAMTAVSVIGGLSGGIIAGLAMTIAIENGIEKPYRDLMRNTSSMHEAARELERVSQTVLIGQVFFTKYIETDLRMESAIQDQFGKIDTAGVRALDAINRI